MAVCIPKMVVLTNSRLTRLFYAMMFLTGFGMSAWFIKSGGYLSSVSLRESVHLNMWVNAPTDEELRDAALARMGDVCGNPSDYDYWYDDYWQHNGSVCVNVSSTCNPSDDCLRTRDIYIKESPQQIFFSTFYKDNLQLQSGTSVQLKRHYLPQASAFRVYFEYFFTAPRLTMFSSGSPAARGSADEEQRLTNKDVLTVFLDAQRDVAWVAEPGESLSVTVPTLLEMAGYPAHLTTPNPAWGENVFPGAKYPEGPIGLIGGMPVELYIHCYKEPLPNIDLGDAHRKWTGPTCFVVANGQEIWSTKYATFPTAGGGLYDIDMSGIRVTGDMDGTWVYFDVNNCILNFTALLVLLRIPKSILIWVTSRALGQLSTIYRKAIFQRFVIEEQAAGMTARIVTHGASFRELEHDDKHGGLTWSSLHDTLRHVSRFRMKRDAPPEEEEMKIFGGSLSNAKKTLERDDVTSFTDFAYKAMINPQYGSRTLPTCVRWFFHTRFWKVIEAVLTSAFESDFFFLHTDEEPRLVEHDSRISVDHFISAAVSSELVELEDLMCLFNKRRRIGCMERWFMPEVMAEHFIGQRALGILPPCRAPAQAPPCLEKGEVDLHYHVKSLASDCTMSNRAIINSFAENSYELHSELQRDRTRLNEELARVRRACKRLLQERTRLSEEMRAVQETCDRQAEHIERLRAETSERRSPPTPTSENIEQRNPPTPMVKMHAGDDLAQAPSLPSHAPEPSREEDAHPCSAEAPYEKHMRAFFESFYRSSGRSNSPAASMAVI